MKVSGNLLLEAGELQQAVIENVAGGAGGANITAAISPRPATAGQLVFNTDDNITYTFDGTSWTAVGAGGGGASALNDLTDVNTGPLGTNDLFSYNGATWVAQSTGNARTALNVLSSSEIATQYVAKAGGAMNAGADLAFTSGGEITGLPPTPSSDTAATSKAYVDSVATGLSFKDPVRVLADSDVVLSGLPTIDGIALANGDRVLLTAQTIASENGIYTAATGAWSRSDDANQNGELSAGSFVLVQEGTVNADSAYVLATDGTIVINTTPQSWVQFSGGGGSIYTGGDGIDVTGTVISILDASLVNAKLVNSSTGFVADDLNTVEIDLGSDVTVAGGTAINTSIAGSVLTIAVDTGALNIPTTTSDLTDVTAAGAVNGEAMIYSAGAYTPRVFHYVSPAFVAVTDQVVTHNLGQQYVQVTIVDSANNVIIPLSVEMTNNASIRVQFTSATDFRAIVTGTPL